jgi:tetratricopeptide (TPR) repeat protein
MFNEKNPPRRVVPRWRSSTIFANTPESKSNKVGEKINLSLELERAKKEFVLYKNIPTASELMFIAREAGEVNDTKIAANFIYSKKIELEKNNLFEISKGIIEELSEGINKNITEIHLSIKNARYLLRQNYNNPIQLIDIALSFTAIGKTNLAEKYIKSALQLSNNNRFILRSAARYYLHVGRPDFAHKLLSESLLIKTDPWIQASEIALSSVIGKTSRLVKSIDKHLQEILILPNNYSELGSAIATVHLNSGDFKKAKKLFTKTLVNPNDNSVAQAEWATKNLSIVLTEQALNVPFCFEAKSANYYRSLEIEKSIQSAIEWRNDEPFTSRPIDRLGYLYCLNEQFDKAQECYRKNIKNDTNFSISNHLNLNFAKIECGEIISAETELYQLQSDTRSETHKVHLLANSGALAYAKSDFIKGREQYSLAIELSKTTSDKSTEGLVRAYFARAAFKYNDPQKSTILETVSKSFSFANNIGATHVLKKIVTESKKNELDNAIKNRISKNKVVWDSKDNTLTIS